MREHTSKRYTPPKRKNKKVMINGLWHDRRTEDGHFPSFDERKGCLRKVRYPTAEIALKVAKKQIVQRSVRVYAYKCRFCDGYHLTHRDPRKFDNPVIF